MTGGALRHEGKPAALPFPWTLLRFRTIGSQPYSCLVSWPVCSIIMSGALFVNIGRGVHCIFTSTLGENPIGEQTLCSPCYYHSPFGTVIVTRVCPFQMLFEHGQTPLYSGICMKNPCKYTSNVETVNSNLTGHIPAIQCHTVFEQFRKTVYDRDGKKGI